MTDTLNDRIAKFREQHITAVNIGGRFALVYREAEDLLAECQQRIQELERELLRWVNETGPLAINCIQKLEAELQAANDRIQLFDTLDEQLAEAQRQLEVSQQAVSDISLEYEQARQEVEKWSRTCDLASEQRKELKQENARLTAQLAELQDELQRQSFASSNVQIHWSEEKQRLQSNLALAVEALKHTFEWLDELGCDCGTDLPKTCAYCEVKAAIAKIEG